MEFLLFIPLLMVILSPLLLLVELAKEWNTGQNFTYNNKLYQHYAAVGVGIGLPLIFFIYNITLVDMDPCGEPAILQTQKSVGFMFWYAFALLCFGISYAALGKRPPLVELMIPTGLIIGLVLPLLIAYHIGLMNPLSWIGSYPVALLYARQLWRNQKRLKLALEHLPQTVSKIQRLYHAIERQYWLKIPVVMALALPIVALITALLYLFGQAPDDLIRAFRETCSYELSQKEYCGECVDGHYLCTVAAYGSPNLVKPLGKGYRHGKIIIVNRQLLASNAFEELLEQNTPRLHRWLRHNYDRYGLSMAKTLHKVGFSNWVYLLMKPLEWSFILILYLFTTDPENRIHQQYTP